MAAPEGPFPGVSNGTESACDAGDPGLIPGSGRSPTKGNGNPLQYSCLENSMDSGADGLHSKGSQRVGHGWACVRLKLDDSQLIPLDIFVCSDLFLLHNKTEA